MGWWMDSFTIFWAFWACFFLLGQIEMGGVRFWEDDGWLGFCSIVYYSDMSNDIIDTLLNCG
ncbi:hypothetical protein BDV27DRAFT_140012 [Aspergillus caelatus]|uniref:Uncharacterized protein n=1 Tax=Aspergillus caelatus TaxID=61420 RepID=A0A5N6ZJC9_9EURO|nr:uncharacterized protein BDV27DRAFT_140012 [Aspergillus caelatus]KAE8357066.1 hypothetical protein BDV27DRAFT_140012 [Aspergillus caelatus]